MGKAPLWLNDMNRSQKLSASTAIIQHSIQHTSTFDSPSRHDDDRSSSPASARRRATDTIPSSARTTTTHAGANRGHEAATRRRSREAGPHRPAVHKQDERSADGAAASSSPAATSATASTAATAAAATYPAWSAETRGAGCRELLEGTGLEDPDVYSEWTAEGYVQG